MLRKSAALRNYIIFCVIILLLIQREIMSVQNVTTAVLLIVSILGTVSTLYYKNRLKELTEIPQPTLSVIINRHTKPTAGQMRLIAEAFGCSEQEVFEKGIDY